MKGLSTNLVFSTLIGWIFGIIFVVIGVLNMVLIHPVPGIFYLLLSLLYFPQVNTYFNNRFGFSIPRVVKIIVGFVILWGTLAVGDLAEMLGL
jgi:hypothetical protein